MEREKPRTIFVIDDNPDDQELIKRGIRECGDFDVVSYLDAEEACSALLYVQSDSPPAFITLDLKMPKVQECQLLNVLRGYPALEQVPMIVLADCDIDDVVRCYDAGATSVVCKPTDYAKFLQMVKTLCEFWGIHHLPSPFKGYLN